MKQLLLLLSLVLVFSVQKNFGQAPCSGTPGPSTATPVSSTVCINDLITLSPNVIPALAGIAYQWESSTVSSFGPYTSIPGATTAIYNSIPSSTAATWYQVVMTCTNGGASTISSPASVYVTTCQTSPCLVAPAASTAVPVSNTVCINGIVTLSPSVVPASSLTNITYQWQSSSAALGPYTSISGATTAIFSTPPNTATTWYQVVMVCVGGGEPTTSSPAIINVINCNPTSSCVASPGATTATPVSSTVCINGIVTLSPSVVPASSVTGISYQWQSSGALLGPYTSISGGTTAIFNTPQNTATTWYQVVMTCTNGGLPTISSPAVVNVTACNPTSPCFTTPGATTATPVSSTVCMNGIITLSPSVVPASSVTGVAYQWQYSTNSALGPYMAIAGATTAIYNSPPNTVTTWYTLTMICTNGGMLITSSPAVVNVTTCQTVPCTGAPGATTATPISSTVCVNGIVTLSPNVVPTSSITGISYQWQSSAISAFGPFTALAGGTTAVFTSPQNTATTWYQVVLTCTNGGITTISGPAVVNVTVCNPTSSCTATPGATTATPVSSTVCMNGIVTLSPSVVPASTVTGISYQWYYSTISNLGPYLSVAAGTTAIFSSPQNTATTWYQVVMTCTNGGVPLTSSPAVVNVTACNPTSPCFTAPGATTATPASNTVCMNGIVTLSPSVVPASSVTGVTYQWQYSTSSAMGPFASVPGATTAIFVTPQNTVTTWYHVIMQCVNGGALITSAPAVVNVTVCYTPCFSSPASTTATPVSNTVCMNGIVTLSPNVVPASTVSGVSYQWQYSTNSAGGPYSSIPGATTAIYPTPPNTVTTWYQVIMTCANGGNATISSPAVVTVSVCNQPGSCAGAPGASTVTPLSSTVCINGVVTLSPNVVPASTVTGITYQWQYSTASAAGPFASVAGANTATYTTPPNTVTTWYQVVITCTNGGVTTIASPAVVNVISCTPNGLCQIAPGATTATPVSSTVCMNGIVTLSPSVVPASTVTGITYQWQYSTGTALGPYSSIAGATTAIYASAPNTVTTWYQVVITCTNGGFVTLSYPAIVTIMNCSQTASCSTSPGAATATPVSNTVCVNGVVTLSPNVVPASTITGVSYQWQRATNSAAGPYSSIAGATTAIYTTPQNSVTTWYQVVITCTNGGIATISSPAIVKVIICDVGINKNHNNNPDFRIYPVPADQSISREMPGSSGSVNITLFSIDGREIRRELQEFKNGKLSMELSDTDTGVYIIEVSSGDKQMRKLFFIER